jgi:hypothetical protein
MEGHRWQPDGRYNQRNNKKYFSADPLTQHALNQAERDSDNEACHGCNQQTLTCTNTNQLSLHTSAIPQIIFASRVAKPFLESINPG